MKGKKMLALAVLVTGIAFVGCKEEKKTETPAPTEQTSTEAETQVPVGDTSETSLDWAGTYTGVTPCADCEGIETTVVLNEDKTFTKTMVYQGKKADNKFEEKGTFTWNAEGTTVTLTDEKDAKNGVSQFKVQEGSIVMLDQEGNVITGPTANLYELKKK